jgi:hypothetical protein
MAVHKEHVPQLKSYDASQVHALHQLRHVAVANGNTARMVSRLRITLEIVGGQLSWSIFCVCARSGAASLLLKRPLDLSLLLDARSRNNYQTKDVQY